jgi:hypothetical protein
MQAIHTVPIRVRRLPTGVLFAATLAFGYPALAAAAPNYDPFGNEDCVRGGGHPLDCCINNNGQWLPGHGPGSNSSEMGVCVPPGSGTGSLPGGTGGAGPAGAQTAPPQVVPRQAVPPPLTTLTPVPANPG